MKFILDFWRFWLLPHRFYGGGGGNSIDQQPNPQAETLAQIANEKWDMYQRKYVPAENQWMDQVTHLNDQSYKNQATGQASSGVKELYGPKTRALGESMRGQRTGNSDQYIKEANDVAQSASKTNSGVTGRYMKGQESVVNIGNGQSTQTINGLGDVAQQSVQGQIAKAKNANDLYQAGLGTAGAVAGGLTAGAVHSLGDKKSGWGI